MTSPRFHSTSTPRGGGDNNNTLRHRGDSSLHTPSGLLNTPKSSAKRNARELTSTPTGRPRLGRPTTASASQCEDVNGTTPSLLTPPPTKRNHESYEDDDDDNADHHHRHHHRHLNSSQINNHLEQKKKSQKALFSPPSILKRKRRVSNNSTLSNSMSLANLSAHNLSLHSLAAASQGGDGAESGGVLRVRLCGAAIDDAENHREQHRPHSRQLGVGGDVNSVMLSGAVVVAPPEEGRDRREHPASALAFPLNQSGVEDVVGAAESLPTAKEQVGYSIHPVLFYPNPPQKPTADRADGHG